MTPDTVAIARPAALPGIAVFIIADIASFMLFFGVFMSERMQAAPAFAASASRLDVGLGLANTLILLTSGWCLAEAERRHHASPAAAQRWLRVAWIVGALFVLIKVWEYREKLSMGITPATDTFFTFYYVFTGLHLLHYIAGMTILALLTRRRFVRQDGYAGWLRSGAMYWHMVDVLWLFIFPLLYLQVTA